MDLEHLSEFLLVLALLCRLKARRMLGAQRDLPQEAPMENPDRDLWYRLANMTFREAVRELADRLEQRSGLRPREAGPDWSKVTSTPQLAFSLASEDLAALARDMMFGVRATLTWIIWLWIFPPSKRR